MDPTGCLQCGLVDLLGKVHTFICCAFIFIGRVGDSEQVYVCELVIEYYYCGSYYSEQNCFRRRRLY